jgi:hypothetical protein
MDTGHDVAEADPETVFRRTLAHSPQARDAAGALLRDFLPDVLPQDPRCLVARHRQQDRNPAGRGEQRAAGAGDDQRARILQIALPQAADELGATAQQQECNATRAPGEDAKRILRFTMEAGDIRQCKAQLEQQWSREVASVVRILDHQTLVDQAGQHAMNRALVQPAGGGQIRKTPTELRPRGDHPEQPDPTCQALGTHAIGGRLDPVRDRVQ